jgi:hypothetical protein
MVLLTACSIDFETVSPDTPNSRETQIITKEVDSDSPDFPTQTVSETAIDQPTPTELVFDFKELLVGVTSPLTNIPCSNYYFQDNTQDAIELRYEFGWLCIDGYPRNSFVTLQIFNPKGDLVDTQNFRLQEKRKIPFELNVDLPTGEWRVVARNGSASNQIVLPFENKNYMTLKNYPLLDPPAGSPTDPRRLDGYQPGETIVVKGINFEPEIAIPVGLYSYDNGLIAPVQGIVVNTEPDGTLQTQFNLNGLSQGIFMILAFRDLSRQDSGYAQLRTQFSIIPKPPNLNLSPMALEDSMEPFEALYPGHSISSSDGQFTFICQLDGKLALYQSRDWVLLWISSNESSEPGICVMQGDGNLVIYDQGGQPVWSSNTWENPGSRLIVQNDGNVVIYNPDNIPIWATNTMQP